MPTLVFGILILVGALWVMGVMSRVDPKVAARVVRPGGAGWGGCLGESGWRVAVAAAAPRGNRGIILDVSGLALAFDAVVAKEDVLVGKPDPEVFLKAAAMLEVEPIRSIVVEDALAGVQGAHAAGMAAIGVGPRHAELGADLSAERLDDLDDDAFDALLARWAAIASAG